MAVRKKLGDLLIESRAIDELQLRRALAHQRQWGGRLGRILVEMRFVQEQQICETVAQQLGIPSVQLQGRTVETRLLDLVPLELCEKHWIFPLEFVPGERSGEKLLLAMSDPTNLAVIDDLQFRTGKHIDVAAASDSQIDMAIRRHFYGEIVPDRRPGVAGISADVQFRGPEIELGELPMAPGGAAPTPGPVRSVPVPIPPVAAPLDRPGAPRGVAHGGDPAAAPAAFVPGGEEIISARRVLFGAPGGLAATAPAPEAAEELAWGDVEVFEDSGTGEEPLVVGTLIEARGEPAVATLRAENANDVARVIPVPIASGSRPDPLFGATALVAALGAMAAGREEPMPPGRLVAGLALALIRNGQVRATDLLAELRRHDSTGSHGDAIGGGAGPLYKG